MKRDTSTYLDFVRFLAALTVVIGHTEWTFVPGFLPFVKEYHLATLAVGVFFVLSGYVIAYSVSRKEKDARSYFVNRAARVYSVVVPMLVLTLALDTYGRWIDPKAYFIGFEAEAVRLLVSLTFVNQAWQWNLPAGTDVPFWSLAYEVPYYLVFGLWFFARAWWWRLLAFGIMVAGGPRIAILFTLWLLGFGCYHLCQRVRLPPLHGRLLLLLSAVLMAITPNFARYLSPDVPFRGTIVDLSQFFLVGIPFAGTIVGFAFSDISLARWHEPIKWMAGATFTLYLLHFPLGFVLHLIIPQTLPIAMRWVITLSVILVATFVVAEFTERRKDSWRRAIDGLLRLHEWRSGVPAGLGR